MTEPFLSIVIPAYNEAWRIGRTLKRIREYVASKPFTVELIAVDDGSSDDTSSLLHEAVSQFRTMRVLRNTPNRGKGFSVRRGVLEAQGEFVLFTDADLSAPIEETDKLFAALESQGADAAVGSRALDRDLIGVHQPWYREFGGHCFNLAVRLLTGLAIHDTQCGLKLFRRERTRHAFELLQAERFGFDPEMLFLIERLGGKIVEVPVRWNHDAATTVHFFRDAASMILDLIFLRWRTFRGQFPV